MRKTERNEEPLPVTARDLLRAAEGFDRKCDPLDLSFEGRHLSDPGAAEALKVGRTLSRLARNAADELEAQEAYLNDARLAHQCSEGVLSMAVARLGGMVEGAPTHRGNFLQRIDELVRKEQARPWHYVREGEPLTRQRGAPLEVASRYNHHEQRTYIGRWEPGLGLMIAREAYVPAATIYAYRDAEPAPPLPEEGK